MKPTSFCSEKADLQMTSQTSVASKVQWVDTEQSKAAIVLKGASTTARQAVHLIFVIDISDSMQDGKLENVKRSVEHLLPLLTPNDMVSMIAFGDESTLVAKCVNATADGQARILDRLHRMHTMGCTNMSAALLDVLELMRDDPDASGSPGHKHGVLLLTDGHANRGVFQPDGLMSIIARLLTQFPNLSLTTVGYGKDHNTSLLRDAATTGGGSYNVVYSLENVATVFGEVLGGLTTVVAQNVKVVLPPHSLAQTAYATKVLQDDTVEIKVGDIYAENEIVILYSPPTANQHSVKVTGVDMTDLDQIQDVLSVQPAETPVPKTIELASFRFQVTELLKDALKQPRPQDLDLRANLLLSQLRALPYHLENIVQMMIDDVESVQEVAEAGGADLLQSASIAQHAAYMGLGRGLRSSAPAGASDPDHDPNSPHGFAVGGMAQGSALLARSPSPPHVWGVSLAPSPTLQRRRTAQVDSTSSPFSNRVQATTSATLRAASTQEQ